jgi:predicted site-specific integrase-resolvase
MIYNLMDRPVITITEAVGILGLSTSTIKRRIATGQIKAVDRENLREKILIYTDSIAKFLEKSGEV